MVDKDSIEKALLFGVVKSKSWDTLILNSITEQYFSVNNKPIYRYIKSAVDSSSGKQYPDLRVMAYEFKIDDMAMAEYTSITDLNALCDALRNDYVKDRLEFEVGKLNEHATELYSNPYKYIERLGTVYESIKTLGRHTRTVGLFDSIENILQIDPSDVISTGFKELDDKLVGWKRGEELAVFMARTGQRKKLDGIKICYGGSFTRRTSWNIFRRNEFTAITRKNFMLC